MPTVTYGPRRIGTAALPGVRKTAAETDLSTGVGLDRAKGASGERQAAALGQLGQTLGQVGQMLGKEQRAVHLDAQRQADEVAQLEYNNKLDAFTSAALFDPQTGALARKGKAAQSLPEETSAAFDQFTGELDGTLNDRQRAAFGDKDKAAHWQNLQGPILRHVFAEQQAHDVSEFNAFLSNSTNAAAAHATDLRQVHIELQDGVDAIGQFATRQGLGTEATQALTEKFTTDTHLGVIKSLIAQDRAAQANTYFTANKDQIAGTQQDDIEKALAVGTTRGKAQVETAKILAAGGSLAEQRTKAKAIDDPDVQDAVLERIEHEANITAKATRDAQESTLAGALNLVERTHDVTKIPAEIWAKFDVNDRKALRSYAEVLTKGNGVETDLPTYYGLMQTAADDPTAFATDNLLKYRGKLDQVEFKQLAKMQLDIRTGNKTAADKDLAGFRTHQQIVDDTLWQTTQTDKEKYSPAQKNARASLLRMVDLRVAAAQDQGKKVTNADIQGVVDDLLSQGTPGTPGSSWFGMFFQSQGWHSATPGKALLDTTIADISPTDRADLERALREHRQPVSDSTVLDLYLNIQTRKKAR
jgi:hypothetical protein